MISPENNGKSIMIICPASRDIITFRKNLIQKLISDGYNVSVIVFDEEYRAEIEKLGVDMYVIEDNNRSVNPFKLLTLKNKYKKIIKRVAPKVVFAFELKPCAFSIRAAKRLGINNIFAMIEGGGDVFGNSGLKWRIIRSVVCRLYKRSLKFSKIVFFINKDDEKEFIERNIVKPEQSIVIKGIGVDLEYFAYKPIVNHNRFLMVSRMLETKGVFDYCAAAREVRKDYPDAEFYYLGGEGTVKVSDIQEYIDNGDVIYLGTTKDVRPYYEECTVQVLPTYYREGLVIVNVEAGSIGRATITCDTIGARDTVIDGYSGFIVPKRDVKALSDKMKFFLEHPDKAVEMGENNRRYVESNYDQRNINAFICDIILNYTEERA